MEDSRDVSSVRPGSKKAPLHLRPTTIDKPWGHEEIFVNGPYVVKKLHINTGHRLSLQYHEVKHETLICFSGKVMLRLGVEGNKDPALACRFMLHPGFVEVIEPNTVHQLTALEDSIILECSTMELDDVVRLQDDYGRAEIQG